MAEVDFSHAVLDVNAGAYPLTQSSYFLLNYSGELYSAWPRMIANGSRSIITDTPTKVSILFSGTFNSDAGTGSTEFYIGYNSILYWRVSNISFSASDTYSFIIDIETSGNI